MGAERSWNKIRYQGGTVQVKVNPFDWNTTLKLNGDVIELNFAGRKTITIASHDVIAVTEGEAAYRRISGLVALKGNPRPVPLFGVLHSDQDHLIGLEFRNADGVQGVVLLLIRKDDWNEVLQTLSALSGKPIKETP